MSEDDDNAGNRALRGWRKPRAIFAFVGRLNQCSANNQDGWAYCLIRECSRVGRALPHYISAAPAVGRAMMGLPGTQQTHRVLAMHATHRNEFVQDTPSFLPVTPGVTCHQCTDQLISCCHTHPPHLPIPKHATDLTVRPSNGYGVLGIWHTSRTDSRPAECAMPEGRDRHLRRTEGLDWPHRGRTHTDLGGIIADAPSLPQQALGLLPPGVRT